MIIGTKSGLSADEVSALLRKATDAPSRPSAADLEILEARVRVYERRYELPSSAVHQAIEDHRLHETADVVEWIFAIRALERARAL